MSKLEKRKKLFFYSILVLLPYVLIAILELGLRIFSVGEDLHLFIPSPDPKYYEINRHVGERYFSTLEHTTPLNEHFLREKPSNGYRIFVLGESTVQGFPYDANLAFSRIVQRRLQDIFPHRTIEVVNLGLTAVNSYTLLDFADELLDQTPDAVCIYAGHNEYYGALGVASMEGGSIPRWLKKLHLMFIHLRTYQVLHKGIGSVSRLMHSANSDEAKATLMEKMVGKNLIPYNSTMYTDGLAQFSDNMSDLLGKLRKKHVPVFMSDLVSNVRDLPPFRSVRYKIYPRADSIYREARQLDSVHEYEKAKDEYVRAKDLDIVRFRASEELNKIISRLADAPGVFPVPLKSLFEKYSPHGLVGNNLMTDHLHPTIDGYFLMAEGFLTELRNHGMPETGWDSSRVQPWTYYRNHWGWTALDSMIGEVRIKHLKAGWPFQSEATVNNFRSTYVPHGIIDSLALATVQYVDVTPSKVHKKLAVYYESLGDFKRASREYLAIAYISPLDVTSYYYAADLASKGEDTAEAIRYLKESPGFDTSSYAQFTLAALYASQKKNTEALSIIDGIQSLHGNSTMYVQCQKLKYTILKNSGLASEAEQTLAEIKAVDPSYSESPGGKNLMILIPSRIRPYIDKAEALRKNGQWADAVAVLKEANSIREIPYTNLLIGKILFSRKNLDALGYLEKAHKEMKGDPSLDFSLSILYLIKRDFPKAKAAIEDFTKLQGAQHPQSVQLRNLLKETIAAERTKQ